MITMGARNRTSEQHHGHRHDAEGAARRARLPAGRRALPSVPETVAMGYVVAEAATASVPAIIPVVASSPLLDAEQRERHPDQRDLHQRDHRGDRVHHGGVVGVPHARVDPDRERLLEPDRERADLVVVERPREREDRARRQRGRDVRQDDVAEHLHPRAPEVDRGLLLHPLEPEELRRHDRRHQRERADDLGGDHGLQAQVHVEPHVVHEGGDPDDQPRQDQRRAHEPAERPAPPVAEPREPERRERAQHEADAAPRSRPRARS